MIDKSNEVFDRVMTYIMSEIPDLTEDNFGSDDSDGPSDYFPFISIVQNGSLTSNDNQDDRLQENKAILMFTVEVYSNKMEGKRSECRKISSLAGDCMMQMNFRRESSGFRTNLTNNSIARHVSTYSVLADNEHFYRR